MNGLREMISKELTNFLEVSFGVEGKGNIPMPKGKLDSFELNCVVSEIYRGLSEGSMYLGLRLGELRDADDK